MRASKLARRGYKRLCVEHIKPTEAGAALACKRERLEADGSLAVTRRRRSSTRERRRPQVVGSLLSARLRWREHRPRRTLRFPTRHKGSRRSPPKLRRPLWKTETNNLQQLTLGRQNIS